MSELPKDPFSALDALQARGIRLFLVGGYAVNALGFSRITEDVDCLIVMDDLGAADSILRESGFMTVRKLQTHARYFNTGLKPNVIDVLLVNATTFEKMWTERGETTYRGIQLPVPKLQHLFAMKLHAIRGQPDRWGKDLRDIHELLKVNSDVVSKLEMTELCRQFGPADKTREILQSIYGPDHE